MIWHISWFQDLEEPTSWEREQGVKRKKKLADKKTEFNQLYAWLMSYANYLWIHGAGNVEDKKARNLLDASKKNIWFELHGDYFELDFPKVVYGGVSPKFGSYLHGTRRMVPVFSNPNTEVFRKLADEKYEDLCNNISIWKSRINKKGGGNTEVVVVDGLIETINPYKILKLNTCVKELSEYIQELDSGKAPQM